jgi:hypothetical protein
LGRGDSPPQKTIVILRGEVIALLGDLLSFLRRGDNIPQGTIVIPQGELTTFPMELLSFDREHITWRVGHCSSCMKINFNISFILLEFPIREHECYHIAYDTQVEVKCNNLNPNVINP